MPERGEGPRTDPEVQPTPPAHIEQERSEAEIDIARLGELLKSRYTLHDARERLANLRRDHPVFSNDELKEKAKLGVMDAIRDGDTAIGSFFFDAFHLGPGFSQSPEFKKASGLGLVRVLELCTPFSDRSSDVASFALFVSKDFLTSPEFQERLGVTLRNLARDEKLFPIKRIISAIPPSPEILSSPELHQYAVEEIKRHIGHDPREARELCTLFKISQSEYEKITIDVVVNALQKNSINSAFNIIGLLNFTLPQTPELIKAAQGSMLTCIEKADIYGIDQLREQFAVPDAFPNSKEAQLAAIRGVAYCMKKIEPDRAEMMQKMYNLPDSVYSLPEVQESIVQGIVQLLNGDVYRAEKAIRFVEKYNVPVTKSPFKTTVSEAAQVALKGGISSQDWKLVTNIQNTFGLSSSESRDAAKGALISELAKGRVTSIEIKNRFQLPESVFSEHETQEAAQKGFKAALCQGDILNASVIEDRCFLSEEVIRKLVEDALVKDLLNNVHSRSLSIISELVDFYGSIYPSLIENPRIRTAATGAIINALIKGEHEIAYNILKLFSIPPETIRPEAEYLFTACAHQGSVENLLQVKDLFRLPNEVFQAAQAAAQKGLAANLRAGRINNAYMMEELFALETGTVKNIAASVIVQLLGEDRLDTALEVKNIFEPDITSVPAANLPFSALFKLRGIEEFQKMYEQDPWHDVVERLLKLQARSVKAEHDPWLTDMKPLVDSLVEAGVIRREESADGELLLEYVKNFGMLNLPQMARMFIDLKRGGKFAHLNNEVQDQLRTIFGKKVERLTGEQIINELRRFRRKVQTELLEDKIPVGLDTELGAEALSAINGQTRWKKTDGPREILETWRRTKEEGPTAALPAGYEEQSFTVPRLREEKDRPAVAPEKKEKIKDLLARKKDDTKMTELGIFFDQLEDAAQQAKKLKESPAEWWNIKRTELAMSASIDEASLHSSLKTREAALREKGESDDKITKILDSVRNSFERKRQQAEAAQERLRDLEYPNLSGTKEESDKALIALMEQVAKFGREKLVKDTLIALSIEHMRQIEPAWSARLSSAVESPGAPISADRLEAIHDFYVQYLNEHYLHPAGEEHQAGHAPFSPELLDALEWAWGKGKDMNKHVLTQTRQALDALAGGDSVVSKDLMTLSLVPVQGLLRIYAGDVGDACYTSKHLELAEGQFPDLHAMIFVTNRGTPQERINGSVLFVETTTPNGKNVLLVRANNPRENLIAQLDSSILVQKTIDRAIDVAKKRGMDMVVIPMDGASSSCSNRSTVAAYYHKKYSGAIKIPLTNEPETNFNGYQNWNVESGSAVGVVWSRN